jgi:hypothetical protein
LNSSSAILYGLVGGLFAVAIEAILKQPDFNWWRNLWWLAIFATAINYCVFRLVQGSPSLPAAFVVFAFTTTGARVALSLWQGHKIGAGTWLAVGLMGLAFLARVWKP